MKKANKYTLLLIVLLIILNIILRLPFTPHEIGRDSYFIHGLSTDITESEHIRFTDNILSVIGYYPYSYATGLPLLLTTLSKITSLDILFVIIIFSIVEGLAGALIFYNLTNFFFNRYDMRLIVTLLFSTSLHFLYFTTWTVSSRGIFIIIYLFVLYCILKYLHSKKFVHLVLSILGFIIGVLFHHLAIFLLGLIILILIFPYLEKWKFYNRGVSLTILMVFLIFVPFALGYQNIFSTFDNLTWYYSLFIMIGRYFRTTGIWLILSIIGVFVLNFKSKSSAEKVLTTIMLIYSPILIWTIYTPLLILPVVSIYAGYGISKLITLVSSKRNQLANFFISLMIIISIFLSALFQVWNPGIIGPERHTTDEQWLKESEINMINYINNSISSNIITNDLTFRMRAQAYIPCQIVGNDIPAVNCNYINVSSHNTKRLPVYNPMFWAESPYIIEDKFQYKIDSLVSWYSYESPETQNLFQNYNIQYLVKNKNKRLGREMLLQSITYEKNKISDNGVHELWELD